MMVAQPLWGILSDHLQKPQLLLTVSLVTTGLVGLSFLVLHHYFLIFIAACVLALFQCAITPLTDSITLNYTLRNGLDYGNFRLWGAAGFAVAAWFMGMLAEETGLSSIFVSFMITLWLSSLFVRFMPREGSAIKVEIGTGLKQLIRLPRFLVFLVASFCVMGPLYSNNSYLGLYYQALGGTVAGVGLCFLLGAGSEIPVWKAAGKWIKKKGIYLMSICAGILAAIRWLCFSFHLPLIWVYLLTATQGFTIGIFYPASLMYIQTVAPPEVKTTAISLNAAMTSGLGNWFFVLIGGMILDAYDIFAVYRFYGLFTLLGVALLAGLMWTDKKTARDQGVSDKSKKPGYLQNMNF
jgi:PPP family 3-phenylpropionic acid transporter